MEDNLTLRDLYMLGYPKPAISPVEKEALRHAASELAQERPFIHLLGEMACTAGDEAEGTNGSYTPTPTQAKTAQAVVPTPRSVLLTEDTGLQCPGCLNPVLRSEINDLLVDNRGAWHRPCFPTEPTENTCAKGISVAA